MADKSPGRTGGDGIRSDPGLLTPLPTAEQSEAPAARPPRPDDCGAKALRRAVQDVPPSLQALRTDLGQAGEGRAGSIAEIRETRTAILKGTGDLAAKLETAETPGGAVEASAGELRDSREAAERLTRSDDAGASGVARPGNARDRDDASGSALADLDAWRDDLIRPSPAPHRTTSIDTITAWRNAYV